MHTHSIYTTFISMCDMQPVICERALRASHATHCQAQEGHVRETKHPRDGAKFKWGTIWK